MKPFGRSLSDFAPFRPAEMRLLESCGRGEVAVIANSRPLVSTPVNTVRAPFLRFLLLGGDERAPVHENGVQLQGACIEEVLELRYVNVVHALDFRYCTFTDCPGFMETCFAHSVSLNGCCLPGLDAVGARVAGSVYLRGGFQSTDLLRLDEMQIDGQLSCSGASLNAKAGVAMSADRIVVKGGMFLDDGFKSVGEIRLLGAHIDVQLNCSNGTFDGFNGDALSADGAVVNGSVVLNQGFKAKGEVRLGGMAVSGELDLCGASLDCKVSGALFANDIQVGGNVLFGSAFHATGEVMLLRA